MNGRKSIYGFYFNDYLFLSRGETKSTGRARDLILANNVFAHIDDMDDVIKGINLLLKDQLIKLSQIIKLWKKMSLFLLSF